jgi:hypothetical protein
MLKSDLVRIGKSPESQWILNFHCWSHNNHTSDFICLHYTIIFRLNEYNCIFVIFHVLTYMKTQNIFWRQYSAHPPTYKHTHTSISIHLDRFKQRHSITFIRARIASFSMMTRLHAGQMMNCGHTQGRSKGFPSSPVPDFLWAHPASSHWVSWVFSPGVKLTGWEPHNSPPSSATVKEE